jgi:hypothetical protein
MSPMTMEQLNLNMVDYDELGGCCYCLLCCVDKGKTVEVPKRRSFFFQQDNHVSSVYKIIHFELATYWLIEADTRASDYCNRGT